MIDKKARTGSGLFCGWCFTAVEQAVSIIAGAIQLLSSLLRLLRRANSALYLTGFGARKGALSNDR